MIHASRKRRPNGSGSWVGAPVPVSFFFLLLFSVLPTYMHQLPGLGWMVLPSAPIRFFFVFFSVFVFVFFACFIVFRSCLFLFLFNVVVSLLILFIYLFIIFSGTSDRFK